MWPVNTPLLTKLYGCKQEAEKTTSFISRAALIVQPANAKKTNPGSASLTASLAKWVKASAPKAESPVFESRLRRDFFFFFFLEWGGGGGGRGVKSYQ